MEMNGMDKEYTASQTSPLVLVLGGRRGLLGQAAVRVFTDCGCRVAVHGREDADPGSRESLRALVDRLQPDWLVNAIGTSEASRAELDKEAAYALNAHLPGYLAEIAGRSGAYLAHFSSVRVFDGQKRTPYSPWDKPRPTSVPGKSKLAGEQAIAETAPDNALIIRTSWLFGPWKTNFIHTLLERARTERILPVAHDAIGSPTYTLDLAYHTYQLMRQGAAGIYHLSNSGRASWCELAAEALSTTEYNAKVEPISSDQALKRAMRPRYHVLDISDFTRMTGQKPRPWPQALRDYMFSYEVRHLWGDAIGAA
jgi:dTDP-4-dehydrorhamnose reductase